MGLPRQRRLRRTTDFARVREQGRAVSGRLLILSWMPQPGLSESVAGFTVTKRIGDAVTRNKVRRRLREIVRHALPRVAQANLIVTIPRYPAVQVSFEDLRREWMRLARKAG